MRDYKYSSVILWLLTGGVLSIIFNAIMEKWEFMQEIMKFFQHLFLG